VADWQVVQARDALEVYYEQFRGIVLEPVQTVSAQAVVGPATPKPAARVPSPRVLEKSSSVPKPRRRQPTRKVDLGELEKAARVALRTEHYALKTEKAYLHWIRRFVNYHHGKCPSHMGGAEIHQFLSHLAMNDRVAASTQNQALNAIVFLYRKVVKKELGDFGDFPRARRPKRLPVVLSRQEVQALFSQMDCAEGLLARLIYGTGMRVSEALRLRVQDSAGFS